MLLAERVEGAGPSLSRTRLAGLEPTSDGALHAACVRWRRSVRHFDRAVSAVARHDTSSRRISNALHYGDANTILMREISGTIAVTVRGLRDKVDICAQALDLCGAEPARHIDDLVLSCLDNAEQMLTQDVSDRVESAISGVVSDLNLTLNQFSENLLALDCDDVSPLQEQEFLSETSLRNEELMDHIHRLTHLSARSARCVVLKGDALRRLIDAGYWECLHRRGLAIAYCDDLLGLLASPSRGPSLFSRASQMIVSFAGM